VSVYVIDTGTNEYYTVAADEFAATEHAVALFGESILYVHWFSDDLTDVPTDWEV
jgi:hypothetical protein